MADPAWLARAGGFGAVLDRALGAYLGFAIGDALGATVEFMLPREIQVQFRAGGGVHRHIIGGGWLKLAPGQVTDDTTMSLALGEALLRGARAGLPFDPGLMAQAFADWLRGRPVDCGNTCRRGIQRFLRDGSLQGPPSEGDGGNGAAMRVLPVVLATLGDEAALQRVALAQARITHHHPMSDAATLGLGRIAQALLAGAGRARALALCEALAASCPAFRFAPYRGRASAYVGDTVPTVLHAFTSQPDFESAVLCAVNRGEDADTTGALVGMLAGAHCGARALPARWLRRLAPAVRHAVADQASALLALAAARPFHSIPA
ncbi:MAG TPA: ADP-ribosyl-[dinitrogen reductase] hydrolase [Ramlibacter sp.]|nr:ADP-ribosyl-[dinitrogen reductase] hydrolase [Ramlibacter sp.]